MYKTVFISSIIAMLLIIGCKTDVELTQQEMHSTKPITPSAPAICWSGVGPAVDTHSIPHIERLIDDFDRIRDNWETTFSAGSSSHFGLISVVPGNTINPTKTAAGFKFLIINSKKLHGQNAYAGIILRKEFDFSEYSGLQFLIRGTVQKKARVQIYERSLCNGQPVHEVWYRDFTITPEWQKISVNFDDMDVVEYWEQDYVSDNKQNFRSIDAISFGVENNFTINHQDTISGNIELDEIWLY